MMKVFSIFMILSLVIACKVRSDSDLKVIGGHASAETRPFFARLYYEGKLLSSICGGALIGKRLVVTAAHCVAKTPWRLEVRIGGNEVQTESLPIIRVQRVLVHPEFNTKTLANDIAILVLDKDGSDKPSAFLGLNRDSDVPAFGQETTVLGFGNTSTLGILRANELREVHVPVLNTLTCKGLDGLYGGISENVICAGDLQSGGRDACQGDSGGPLIAGDRPVLVGIVSFGDSCGQKNAPGIYTRVSSYVAWIDEQQKRIAEETEIFSNESLALLVKESCYPSRFDNGVTQTDKAQIVLSTALSPAKTFEALPDSFDWKSTLGSQKTNAECDLKLANQSQGHVAFTSEKGTDFQSTVYQAFVNFGGRWYRGNEGMAKTVFLNCKNSPQDLLPTSFAWHLGENPGLEYSSDYAYGHGALLDQREVGRGVAAAQPAGNASSRFSCGDDRFHIDLYEEAGSTFAKLKIENGPPRWLQLEKIVVPSTDDPQAILKLTKTSDRTAELVIENRSNLDLYSWSLSCNIPFSIESKEAAVDGDFFRYTSMYPEHQYAKVEQGASLHIDVEFFDDILSASELVDCHINNKALRITL